MRHQADPDGVGRVSLRVIVLILAALMAFLSVIPSITPAAVPTSITPTTGAGNLNTTVTQNGNVYYIVDGTRAGTNLFHSFGNFSVGAGDMANFLNTPVNGSLPFTSNILGRVTGGNISNIFGTIQTTGFGSANLFLMNPAGFLFGPNATVNVGGMIAFTSADYLKLADGARFNAIPNASADALLSASPVAAFGFLGSNPGTITVQGSHLSVTPEQTISFVGGNITVRAGTLDDGTVHPARLSAPGGQINLVSVASPGEVLTSNFEPASNMALGSITLSQGSVLAASAEAAGTIKIRSGQLVIADATLLADTGNATGASAAIDINVTGDMSITDTRGVPAITARTSGSGDAGEIRISSGNLTASSNTSDPAVNLVTLIDSHTTGTGNSGNINVTTGNLSFSALAGPTQFIFIDSGTVGPGNGRDVTINAHNIQLENTTITTGDFVARFTLSDTSGVTGSAGNLIISADSLQLNNAELDTAAFAAFPTILTQKGGDITLNVRDIEMLNSQISLLGPAGGGALTLNANTFHADSTFIETDTVSGPGGNIIVNARVVELTNGGALISSTFGVGDAGNIVVTATDHISLIGHTGPNPLSVNEPSGLFSNSTGDFGSHGNAGNVVVTTPRLEMIGGRINTVTASSGGGGNVTLSVQDVISISGEFLTDPSVVSSIFDIGPLAPSGIVTQTIGSDLCTGLCGNAGNISITTGSLNLGSGGQIDSGTSSTGGGGDIVVHASNQISMSGTLSNGSPVGVFSRSLGTEPGSGAGGNITLTAGQSVTISNGASVSASSTGTGIAGDITINAGQNLELRDSSIKTEAEQARGGNIDIQAIDRVRLVNSTISTSVLDSNGNSGNISIDPNVVVLQNNSKVIAQAVRGAGGNIVITTPLFLADSSSVVNASSQFGLNGTVTARSNLSGSLGTLPSEPNQAHSLLTQRCAALAIGQTSSFVVAGREQLPADPGGWLTSPLAFAALGESLDADHAVASAPAIMPITALDIGTVSLRRLTPAGFLMANFANSETTGCHS